MKIQYENKEFINADLGTPNKNKVTDDDMNQIKSVVNANADTLDDTTERMTNLEQDADTRIGSMEEIVDFGQDITQIQDDIEGTLKLISITLKKTRILNQKHTIKQET